MIESKEDLQEYILKDKEKLGRKYKKPHLFGDEVWKFEISLRMCEYYKNTKSGGGGFQNIGHGSITALE